MPNSDNQPSPPQKEIAPNPTKELINACDWTYSEEFGPFKKGEDFENPGIPQEQIDRAIADGLLKVA